MGYIGENVVTSFVYHSGASGEYNCNSVTLSTTFKIRTAPGMFFSVSNFH